MTDDSESQRGKRKKKVNPPDIKNRTVTFRFEPTSDQRRMLFARMNDYRSYANRFIQAKRAQAVGYRPPENSPVLQKEGLKGVIEAHERLNTAGLSANCYLAAEEEVGRDWKRKDEHGTEGYRRYPAGAPIPQYRADTLGISTISGAPGVKINAVGSDFTAALHINANEIDDPNWIEVPIRFDERDKYRWPMLTEFARRELAVDGAKVLYRRSPGRGEKWLLQIAYKKRVPLPALVDRAATISFEAPDNAGAQRLSVRNGISREFDLTRYLNAFLRLKGNLDGIRRRKGAELGRSRGSRRLRRRIFAQYNLANISKTYWQKVAKKVIRYCIGSACGMLRVMDLGGGDWPAYQFAQYLKTCGENCGVQVVEVTAKSALTETDVKAAEKQARKRKRPEQ